MKKTGQALDTAFVFFAGSQLFRKFRLNSTTLGKITFLYGVARATISWATTSSEKEEKPPKQIKAITPAHQKIHKKVMDEVVKRTKQGTQLDSSKGVLWVLNEVYTSKTLQMLLTHQDEVRRIYVHNRYSDRESLTVYPIPVIRFEGRTVYLQLQLDPVPLALKDVHTISSVEEVEASHKKEIILSLPYKASKKVIFAEIVKLGLLARSQESQTDLNHIDLVQVMCSMRCQVAFDGEKIEKKVNGETVTIYQESFGVTEQDIDKLWAYVQRCNRFRRCAALEQAVRGVKGPNMAYSKIASFYSISKSKPNNGRVTVQLGKWTFIFGKGIELSDEDRALLKEAKVDLQGSTFVQSASRVHTVQLARVALDGKTTQIMDRKGKMKELVTPIRGLPSYTVMIQHQGLSEHDPKRNRHFATFLLGLAVGLNDERKLSDICGYVGQLWAVMPELLPREKDFILLSKFATYAEAKNISHLKNSAHRSRSSSPNSQDKLSNKDPVSEKFNAFKSELEGKIFPVACKVFLEQVKSVQCVETDKPMVGGDVIEVVRSQPEKSDTYVNIDSKYSLSVWDISKLRKKLGIRLVCESGTTDQCIFNNLVKLALGKQCTKFLSPEDVFRVVWDLMAQRKGFDQHSLQTLWEFAKKLNVELFEKQVKTRVFNSPEGAYQCLQNHCHYQDGIKASSLILLGDLCFSSSEDTTKNHSHIHWNCSEWDVTLNNQTWTISKFVADAHQSLKEWWQRAKQAKTSDDNWVDIHYKEKTSPIALMLGMSVVSKGEKLSTKDVCAMAYKLWTECGSLLTIDEFSNLCDLGNRQGGSKGLKNFNK